MPSLTTPEKLIILAVSAPLLFVVILLLGRYLKRRMGVHLDFMYRLLCLSLAVYIPLKVLHLDFQFESLDLRRESRAAVVLLGAFFIVALIERYFWEGYYRKKTNAEIPKFLHELIALIVIVVAVMFVLSGVYNEGKALAGILAGSGIAAIILGFAMQDLLGNIISGIALEIAKPFRRGEWLIVDHQHAEVMEVNWRSTRLRNNDNVFLDIPNSQIVKNTITNLSYHTRHHAERITVGVDYNVPPNHVREILLRAARDGFQVLQKPAPKVFVKSFADSAVIYEVKFWIERDDQYNDILDSVHTNIWYELNRNQIKIPYPIRTVQIERPAPKSQQIPAYVLAALRRQAFFQCLDDAQTQRLLSTAQLLRFGRGEKLIEQGADGRSMFVLVNGSVDVHVHSGHELNLVATLKAGDYFGEMSLLTGEKRSATVIAKQDCDTLEIDKETFAEVLQSNPELLKKLSEMLAQRRLETEGILASSATAHAVETKQEEYAANFLARLYSFFQL